MNFEEEYEGELQAIEFALLSRVEKHQGLCDHDMLNVIGQVLKYYKYEERGDFELFRKRLAAPLDEVFTDVIASCEWRLGEGDSPFSVKMDVRRINRKELVLCLKRIEKSIKFWTSQSGRFGYINFVKSHLFLPIS